MKALVTGVGGFIGSTLAERLVGGRSRRGRHRLLHRLLPAADQGTQPRVAARPRRVSASWSRRLPAPISARLVADRTHVFHLAAQAGVRKSWGRDFSTYTTNNIEATQLLLEALVGSGVSGSSTPRARRCTATPWRFRCGRMRCRSPCHPTASPSCRPNSCATSTTSTTGSPRWRSGISRFTDRVSGRTWVFTAS